LALDTARAAAKKLKTDAEHYTTLTRTPPEADPKKQAAKLLVEDGKKALAAGVKLAADGKKGDAGKRFDEAAKAADAALELDPDSADAKTLKKHAEEEGKKNAKPPEADP